MQVVGVGEFKTNFSDILKILKLKHESFIIEYGKKKEAVAVLIPYDEYITQKKERKLGLLQDHGDVIIAEDFKMDDESFLKS